MDAPGQLRCWPPDHPLVTLTNPDKVLYPATGTTKAEVFDYYVRIAEMMLPHVAGRPATRKRWPNGVAEPAFFEKQLADSAPDWLARARVPHHSRFTTYPILDSTAALAWIGQQAALEVHVPQWRFIADVGRVLPGPATRLIFDLDPGPGVGMAQLCEVARAIRVLLESIGLTAYPLTSGSAGVHLYAPLDKRVSSRGASTLAKRIALQLEKDMPATVTASMSKTARTGRVLVDWSQNSAAKTTVAPYSLRGVDQPTVAAPRTWAELDDPSSLRQIRFDEILDRVGAEGDLLAGMDDEVRAADRLTTYRSMRDPARTPEPVPSDAPNPADGNTFVIQEHHARRLHYDFRLERDGVLVSWAVPKNLPDTPSVNHLAVRTEDHPLEYGSFAGVIPKGEYGAGTVSIWDSGTYDTEKFIDTPERGEVIVVLHGQRISGRYALIRTGGNQWLAHRMKDQPGATPDLAELKPMLATVGEVSEFDGGRWAFEGKWDGHRLLVGVDGDEVRLRSRSGREVTAEFPALQSLAPLLAGHRVILDGEVVATDQAGRSDFSALRNPGARVEFWAFDVLVLDGRSLLRVPYADRRRVLEALGQATGLTVPPLIDAATGAAALEFSRQQGFEGVVAKDRTSVYQPGRRSPLWVKDKNWLTQAVVIGGWVPGRGVRSSTFGALLTGVPGTGGLTYLGKVGTGFDDAELGRLTTLLAEHRSGESPFSGPVPEAAAVFTAPAVVGEVRYAHRTVDGLLRHPSWRGLRPDLSPADVVLEA